MTARIDVFTPKITDCPSFTVNVAVTSVNLTNPVAGSYYDLLCSVDSTINEYKYFEHGECFNILSAGLIMPDSFVLTNYSHAVGTIPVPLMGLRGTTRSGGFDTDITPFGNSGHIRVPFENYEISLGVFVDSAKLLLDEDFKLSVRVPFTSGIADYPQVSMLNVPAAVDGEIYYVIPFVKIEHNNEILT